MRHPLQTAIARTVYIVMVAGFGGGLACHRALSWIIGPTWLGCIGAAMCVGAVVALKLRAS